jgi:lipopolysaccharide export system protein LptA
MMNKKIFLFLLIIFLIVPVGAEAARELNGDQLDLQQTEAGQVITAEGNVELIYDELRITADDEAIYRRYNGEIEFRKNVKFFYQQYQGQSVELTGNLEQEIIHLIGEAQITGPKSYIEADRIDIYQAEDRIEVQGNVYLEYNDFWAEADQLTYYTEREFMHLEGNVKGERNGESFAADAADINQKTEEVKLQGQARVILPREEDSDTSSGENSGAAENDN